MVTKHSPFAAAILSLAFAVNAVAGDINLWGWVGDASGSGVAGVDVALKDSSFSATTDSSGKWSLVRVATTVRNAPALAKSRIGQEMVFNILGRRMEGSNLARGVYVIRDVAGTSSVQVNHLAKAEAVADSLIVSYQGSVVGRIELTSLTAGALADMTLRTVSPLLVPSTAGTAPSPFFMLVGQTAHVSFAYDTLLWRPMWLTVGTNSTVAMGANFSVLLANATDAVTLNLASRAQGITFAALGDKTYGDANFLLSATAGSTLNVTFTSQTPSVCTVSGVLASIASAGVCTIQADQAGDSIFNAATSAVQSFTVAPKPVTVVAYPKTKVYGDADPALTYVTVGLVGSDVLTGTLSRAVGEIVGTYAITSTLTNPNYAVTFTGANLVITAKPVTVVAYPKSKVYGDADPALTYVTVGLVGSDVLAGTLSRATSEIVGTYAISLGTLANPNYAITFVGANLVITAKPITVTANAQTKVYGSTDPTLTYTATGLVGTDVLTCSLSRAVGEIVGTYAITGTLTNSNYTVTFVGANLSITAKPITVTANAQSKTYGDALTLGTTSYVVTSGTLVYSDDITGVTLTSAGTVGTAAVGSYTITPSAAVGSNLANYTITYAIGTLTVNPRTITVTANAAAKLRGSTDPELTYTCTGTLVNGDVFTGSLTRASGETVGTYAIVQGTLGLTSNYSLTFVGANFTINGNSQTCAYDATANTLTCTEQTYKTVVIGAQTWMAENLNYTPTAGNSWCYGNVASNCTTYGRLYDYPTALSVCPTGWHLPDTTAWNTLEAYVGAATAGNKLKAVSSLWTTYSGITNTDDYGFSALPAGYYYGRLFGSVGYYGDWWTATANGSSNAYDRGMSYDYAYVDHGISSQTYGFSARCLKDVP